MKERIAEKRAAETCVIVAIVYHSHSGRTKAVAQSIEDGVKSVECTESRVINVVSLREISKLDLYLNDVHAMIFGSPTYMGSVSAQFKNFMDKSSALWQERKWKDKIAAGFTNAHSLSGDKLGTLIQMAIFAAQHGMIWVGQDALNTSPEDQPGSPQCVNRLGSFLGLMTQSSGRDANMTPPIGDLETAKLFGARVAHVTKQYRSNY